MKLKVKTCRKGGGNAFLRALVEAKQISGLSQKTIAERIGKPQSNVSRMEHSNSVSFKTFCDYLAACGFDFIINLKPQRKDMNR